MPHVRRPIVLACIAFLAGAALGLRFGAAGAGSVLAAGVLAAAGCIALEGSSAWRPLRGAAPYLAIALAGAGQGAESRAATLDDCLAGIEDGVRIGAEGVLVASHAGADSTGRVALLTLRAEPFRAGSGACAGELRVRLPSGFPAAAAGSRVRLHGVWWRNPAPVLPGAWPRAGGSPGFLMAREAAVTATSSPWSEPLLWARGRTQAAVLRLFPRHAALADALLLNRREHIDAETTRRFSDSGLVHLLAISGSHVAMIGAALLLLVRALGFSRRTAAWSTIVLTAGYLALIGAPASALRSGVMLALLLLGGVLQRPASPLSTMAAAALTLVALDPLALLDAGFQLSFAGVLGLSLLRPAILARLPVGMTRGWRRPAADALVSSVAAFATTAPIVAFHFGQSAPVSILANLPAIPLTSLALVGVAAAVVIEPLAPPLARLVADGASLCLDLLDAVAGAAAAIPGGHFGVARPSIPFWAAAVVVAGVVLHLTVRMRALVRWTLVGGSVGVVLLFAPAARAASGAGLELAFLDVGQGDAVALRTPAGRWVLFDAGPLEERYDAGERRVLPFLRARGATRVEAMVLTHPHADHIGGAPAVLRGIPVGRVVEPGLPFGSPIYRDLLETTSASGAAWAAARQDRVLRIDGVELVFLWPTPGSLDSPEDANDISAVVQIRYGAFSALLTGDAPDWVEERLVARYGDGLRSQVLKAGHHGSRTSTSDALLRAVRPALVVVSCGRRNRYGHPAPETLARLVRAGPRVARTDRDGTVVLRVDAGGGAWRWEVP